jgi:RNA polymerase sigma-70 factor (ECF subfamily)
VGRESKAPEGWRCPKPDGTFTRFEDEDERRGRAREPSPNRRFLGRINAMTAPELKTRASLIERLRDRDDRDSWREFFDRYWKLVYGLAIKSGLTEEEAQDVVQETMVSISKNLDEYQYKPQECSFKSWIFRMAKWRIIDEIRKRPPAFTQSARPNREPDRTPTVERVADDATPQLDQFWEEEWQKNLLDVALARVKQRVSIKEFQIFDLYVLKAWPVSEVRKMLHVSAAHVYVTKHRVSTVIKREIKKLEEEMG